VIRTCDISNAGRVIHAPQETEKTLVGRSLRAALAALMAFVSGTPAMAATVISGTVATPATLAYHYGAAGVLIPEPAVWAMIIGFSAVGLKARRRRARTLS